MDPVLFATDYDGTLWFHENGLRQGDVEAISDFQKQGNLFVLATGRPEKFWKMMQEEDLKNQVHFDYRIFSNGALVLDEKDIPMFEQYINDGFVRYALSTYPDYPFILHPGIKSPFYGKEPEEYASVLESHSGPYYLYGISFPVNGKEGEEIREDLNRCQEVQGYYNPWFHDIVARGVSKGKTIRWLAEKLGLPYESTAGMGDSWNDIPMLELCYDSYTFPDSPQDVQKTARGIEPTLGRALRASVTKRQKESESDIL